MSKKQLLNIFLNHQNEWLSGNQLAEQLQISRTMIWKNINSLKESGYQIERKHSLGYRYLGTTTLSAETIAHLCSQDVSVKCFGTIDSTNKYAKNLVNEKVISKPTIIIANQQTAGYGRRGRSFYSPANSGLYLTIIVPNVSNPINPGLLTTTTAVTVVNGLKKSFPKIQFGLKWINDIWINDRKVAGIMTETIMDIETMQPTSIIVGIGINLSTENFPKTITQPVTAITNKTVNRNQIAANIINQFLKSYPTYKDGTEMNEYRKLSVVIGHQVTININRKTLTGIVKNIDDNGALILEDNEHQIQHITAGEVTKVRLKNK